MTRITMKRAAVVEQTNGEFLKKPKLEIDTANYKKPLQNKSIIGFEQKTPLIEDVSYRRTLHAEWGSSYEVLKEIGTGVYGTVFIVNDAEKKTKYAMKIAKSCFHDTRKLFDNEVAIMKHLSSANHENLVHLVQSGESKETETGCSSFSILMDLHGPSVFDVMSEAKKRKPNEVVVFQTTDIRNIGLQVLAAMKHLEQMKIYHLDLKPENVLYSLADNNTMKIIENEAGIFYIQMPDSRVRVGDFSCSRLYQAQKNKDKKSMVQTQNYRAPEIIMGLPISEKSDVWSFACLLAEMYTGELLFYGNVQKDSELVQFAMMQKTVRQFPSPRMWREAINIRSDKVESSADGIVQIKGSVSNGYLKVKPLFSNLRPGDIESVPLFVLLRFMLLFDPESRPSFSDVAAHSFFS